MRLVFSLFKFPQLSEIFFFSEAFHGHPNDRELLGEELQTVILEGFFSILSENTSTVQAQIWTKSLYFYSMHFQHF